MIIFSLKDSRMTAYHVINRNLLYLALKIIFLPASFHFCGLFVVFCFVLFFYFTESSKQIAQKSNFDLWNLVPGISYSLG